jgi:hypothetical protein
MARPAVASILSRRYARMHIGLHAATASKEGCMTTTFDKREEGFEKQFAHDEELKFKAIARRNKMIGLWAAGMLGKSGAEAESYAKEVVLADIEHAGDEDVVGKLVRDLKSVGVTEQEIRAKMSEVFAEALAQVKKSG